MSLNFNIYKPFSVNNTAQVITQEHHDHSWQATYPGFDARGSTEQLALERLAKAIRAASDDVMRLATRPQAGDKAASSETRWLVGDRLALTIDCEIGSRGDEVEVVAIDHRSMKLRLANQQIINTGADYRYLTRVASRESSSNASLTAERSR